MAAVGVSTPNGVSLDDAPTPDGPGSDIHGGAGSEEDGDLFGSDDDADQSNINRKLDDSELDSGDDEGRADRLAHTVEDEDLVEEKQIAEAQTDLAPIRPPEGDELYLLNLPSFLGLAHKNYNPASYEPPTKPHDKDTSVDDTTAFSPFDTATSTMFWRRDPKNPDNLQSNARIIRWSDGTLTMQLATKPIEHYRITTSALRQNYNAKKSRLETLTNTDYDPTKDTNNYLAAYHASQGVDLQLTRPLDASMKIQPTGDVADEAILRLQADLAASQKTHDPLTQLKSVRIDPEEARRRTEAADKEAAKLDRKRRNAQEALEFRREQTLRRGGLGGRGGLSVAGLEDDDGMPTARGRKSNARKRKINRRGEIYSDDEDDTIPRGRTREDEYDREDDFLADSDEDPETYEGDEDDLLDDEEDEDAEGEVDDAPPAALPQRSERSERPRERRSATPKRPADDDADQGAMGSPQARKKRRVIDDEDDE